MIERAAADGSGRRQGTHVVGLVDAGAWAQLAAIPTGRLAPIPNGVTDAQAATLPTAGMTALRTSRCQASYSASAYWSRARPAASGGSRSSARESGAHVTAFVLDAAAAGELLRGLGAADVVETLAGAFDLIIDGVKGATFGLAIQACARGMVVNLATQRDDEIVTFQAARFDRAKGARIYTLNLFDELARHASGAGDLARLYQLMAEGRLDGQIELEASWRDAAVALGALLDRASAARLYFTSADRASRRGQPVCNGVRKVRGLHGANRRVGLRRSDLDPSSLTSSTQRRQEMRRITSWPMLLAAIAATALASTGSSSAAAAKTVNGTVGPGFTIGLTMQSKKVTRLRAGVSYRFVISDRSSGHNFRLTGPRLNRELTSVGYTGTRSYLLKLGRGHTASSATRMPTSCAAASWSPEPRPSGGGRGPRPPIFSAN